MDSNCKDTPSYFYYSNPIPGKKVLILKLGPVWGITISPWLSQAPKIPIQWLHNERDGISNYWCPHCSPNHLLRHKSKKTSRLCVTGLCEGTPPVTGGFPSQRASNVENVSIQWHHHALHHHLSIPSWGPFYLHGLTLIPTCISNYMPGKMWDKITYPFLSFNGCTIEA